MLRDPHLQCTGEREEFAWATMGVVSNHNLAPETRSVYGLDNTAGHEYVCVWRLLL